jgi:hypothetical protein
MFHFIKTPSRGVGVNVYAIYCIIMSKEGFCNTIFIVSVTLEVNLHLFYKIFCNTVYKFIVHATTTGHKCWIIP